jgi:hypothetical protein
MTEVRLRSDAPWESITLDTDYIVDKTHWIEYNPSINGIVGVRKFFDFREGEEQKYLGDIVEEEKQAKIDSKKNKNKNKDKSKATNKKSKSELPDLP